MGPGGSGPRPWTQTDWLASYLHSGLSVPFPPLQAAAVLSELGQTEKNAAREQIWTHTHSHTHTWMQVHTQALKGYTSKREILTLVISGHVSHIGNIENPPWYFQIGLLKVYCPHFVSIYVYIYAFKFKMVTKIFTLPIQHVHKCQQQQFPSSYMLLFSVF